VDGHRERELRPALHEVPVAADGNLALSDRVLPETLAADAGPVIASFFDYFRTARGFHPRSIDSTTG